MVRNAEKGYKGMSFIQFSFSFARFALQIGGGFTKQFARPTTSRDLFCRLFKNWMGSIFGAAIVPVWG